MKVRAISPYFAKESKLHGCNVWEQKNICWMRDDWVLNLHSVMSFQAIITSSVKRNAIIFAYGRAF